MDRNMETNPFYIGKIYKTNIYKTIVITTFSRTETKSLFNEKNKKV